VASAMKSLLHLVRGRFPAILNRSSDVLAIARDLASFASHCAGMSWDPWHLNEVEQAHAEAQASLEAFVSQNPFACGGASEIAASEAAAAAGFSPGAAAALTSAAATAAPAASSSSAGEVKDLIKTVDTVSS
jgi:hypothetical protein